MKVTDSLVNALIKAQQEINHVVQDGTNPFFKSDYATLKEVIDSVKKPLNDNGIYLQQESVIHENGTCVETIFYGHGGKLSTGKVFIPAVKHDPQAFGSSLSYAKRYSLLMACGVATKKEDDDGEVAMRRTSKYEIVDSKGVAKQGFNTIDEYLAGCRIAIGDPNNVLHKKAYEANKWKIKGYLKDEIGDAKNLLAKIIEIYEEPKNAEKIDS